MSEEELRTELARRIRLLRTLRGMGQQDAADRIGMKRATLSYIETATQGVSMKQLYRIGKAFDIPPHIMIGPLSDWQQEISKEL